MSEKLDPKEVARVCRDMDLVRKEISKAVVGQELVINGLLRALLANGHVLVEGVPGIAKTLIIKTLANVMTSNFQRVQFTSDLLPTDILGLTAYDKTKGFYIVRGPVFTNFLLADEINRSPGKCVTKDTDIMLGNGELMSIKDVFKRYNGKKTYKRGNESWIVPKEDFYVPSFNLDTYKIEPRKVKYLFKQRVREPYYEVSLTSGRKIKTSKVHPFFSLINGDIENINAEDLENGNCVLVPKRVNIKGDNILEYNRDLIRINENVKNEIKRRKKLFLKVTRLKYLEPKQIINKLKIKNKKDEDLVRTYLRSKPKYLDYKLKDTFLINAKQFGQVRFIKMPKSVDKKLAKFIAFLIAETYHKSNGDIFISMKDKKMIVEFKNILNDIFGYKVRILRDKRDGKYRLAISSKTLTTLLIAMGYKVDAHSGDKQIPNFILKSENDIIKEFLRMYFECDGWVNRDCVSVTSKSRDIANKIAYLLLRQGIVGRIGRSYKKTNVGEGYFYNINLYGNSVKEFKKKIGFFSKEKNKKLMGVYKNITNRYTDFIPNFHSYLRDLRKKLNLTHKEFHKLTGLYAFQLEYPKNRSKHSRAILNRVYNGIKNVGDVSHLKKLIDGDFYCDFVKDIKIVKPKKDYYLYDFTIEDTHSFIAGFGGIISHNTQSALLEAMQEKQVTIGRETFTLEKPFFVLATQNPIETIATYPLPEAQIDRFLFKLYIGYPNKKEEQDILKKNMTTKGFEDFNIRGVVSSKEILHMQEMCKKVFVNDEVESYIIRIVDATRYPDKYKLKLGKYIAWGSSPRASIGLYIGAKAEALLNGKSFVTPQHVKDVAHDVLRHRVILNYEGQAENIKADDIVTEILAKVPTP